MSGTEVGPDQVGFVYVNKFELDGQGTTSEQSVFEKDGSGCSRLLDGDVRG